MRVKVIGGMVPDPPIHAREILSRYAHLNLGDMDSYPELLSAWNYVLRTTSLLSLNKVYPGIITSGATESNILACYLAREAGFKRILYFRTAHYSVVKAAKLLGMDHLELPVINGYEPDLNALENTVNDGDVIVATIGNTFTGYVDPVKKIERIASKKGAVVHVDAAFSGIIIRYLGIDVLNELNSTVRTFVTDLHKIPEAPIGVGVLLAYSQDYLDNVWFKAPYIPSGKQYGILGTRAGAPLIAAKEILSKLEDGDLSQLAKNLMRATLTVYEELVVNGPYDSPHKPQTPIICLVHKNIDDVIKRLRSKGYITYTCRPLFNGIRLAIMPHTLKQLNLIIDILREAAIK